MMSLVTSCVTSTRTLKKVDMSEALTRDGFGRPKRSRASDRRVAPNRVVPNAARTRKRLFDLTVASLALVVLSPVFAVIAVAIKIWDPGPVFFAHVRIGQNGRAFLCLKFRTMIPQSKQVLEYFLASDPEAKREWSVTRKLKYDPRVTRFGRILRRTSLDELPQLINVVRGDMSLVGPRPIVKSELTYYGRRKSDYLSVRPGITGLWQVSGRSDTNYPERVSLDLEYIRTMSLFKDCIILLRTVRAVASRAGSY